MPEPLLNDSPQSAPPEDPAKDSAAALPVGAALPSADLPEEIDEEPIKTSRLGASPQDTIAIIITAVVLAVIAAGLTIFGLKLLNSPSVAVKPSESGEASSGTTTETGSAELQPEPKPEVKPERLNLQPVVNSWLGTLGNGVGVGLMIYDLDNHKTLAEYHPDQKFDVASIYKLFFVYGAYQQIDKGVLNGNDVFVKTTDYRAGTYTLGQCLDLMVRESYNGCADVMNRKQNFIKFAEGVRNELGLKSTTNMGLTSTAADLTKLMRLYWEHPDLTMETWVKIADSMLNQPPTRIDGETVYDWRQGLPAGFSVARVYDKVGWKWNEDHWDTYADAAILDFAEAKRHFSVVVITTGVTDPGAKPLRQLGTMVETAILESLQ